MKRGLILLTAIVLPLLILLSGCEKKDKFDSEDLSSFFVLEPGKYILYRLDSLKFPDFGRKDTIVTYQAKDVVDASFTDSKGRKAWRIIRYLRNFNSTNESDWRVEIAYSITATRNEVEYLEENLTFRKLSLPVTDGYNWRGNSMLPNRPFYGRYRFSNDIDIQQWDYFYEGVGQPITINNKDYENTITVVSAGDSSNVPITAINGVAYRDHWVESYAKGVGLVYKEAVMWEYQPINGTTPAFKAGFGIKLTILDHN